MEIVSKRNRINNKFYDGDYDLDLRPSPRIKRPKHKRPPTRLPDNFNDSKKLVKNPDCVEDVPVDNSDKNTSPSKSDIASPTALNENPNFDEKVDSTLATTREPTSYPTATMRFHDPQFMNSIMNLSSINSESHKIYEVENLEFFKKMMEERFSSYSHDDNRLIGNLPNELIVNNSDHQFLYPWIDLITPNRSKPYCTNLRMEKDNKFIEDSDPVDSALTNSGNSTGRILYLTENQMFQVIANVLDQIVNTPSNIPVLINWKKVSRACQLSQEVCKDFFWSFDKTHIKDEIGGCFFSGDWYHYYKVDDWYFLDLKHRVQCLIRLADECRLERERILYELMEEFS